MKFKKSVLASSVTAIFTVGAMAEAAASLYAGSALDIDGLVVGITPGDQWSPGQFNFDLSNSASLNGVGTLTSGACGGSVDSNNCGIAPTLDAVVANAPGSVPLRAENGYNFIGPTNTNYANADSIINDAQLVTGLSTDTDNVAEANLTTAISASAQSEIQSITGLTFTFTLDGPGSLTLDFMADPDMRAFVSALDAGTAQANLNTSFNLRQDVDANGGSLDSVDWNPQGTGANDCAATGSLTCSETADSQDLNITIGSTTSGADVIHSFGAGDLSFGDSLTAFGISIGGLDAGTWTLSLNESKSVSLLRSAPAEIPEPGLLALIGLGLISMVGFRTRRT